jgi:glucose/arabinose dehydrogenase
LRTRYWIISLVVFVLILSLAACAGSGREAGPPTLAAELSPEPSTTPSAAATTAPATETAAPSVTPTEQPPTATPSPTPVEQSPTPTPTLPPVENTPTNTALPSPAPATVPAPTPTVAGGTGRDPAAVRVELQRVAGGLDTPVGIANAGDGSGRLFILEKGGRIRIVQDGVVLPDPFLDITDRVGASSSEQGLLGLAFHPNYGENGLFFVNYTDGQGDTVVSRFSARADASRADPASEVVLLSVDQPAANHNGGHLAFGPDGYLYVGLGDGGGAGDRYGNGQNGQTLLGALLRLDVDRGQPYTVPADNPFTGNPQVRDEIWALGLRNPWRFSFDRLTGNMYIADVGQNLYEEVNYQAAGNPGGQNYGWPIMEGLHCFPADRSCGQGGLTLPVHEYDHSQGCSVTGGHVYRGQEFPFLNGIYLFGDYCSGTIWGLARGDGGGWQVAPLAQANVRLASFGEDEVGELYLVDIASGELFRIGAGTR